MIINFAQTTTQCTVNGRLVDCSEVADQATKYLGLGIGILVAFVILGIAAFVFWVFMLVHAIQHDSPNRSTWLIILSVALILGFGFIAALVYFFVEKNTAEQHPAGNNQPVNNVPQQAQAPNPNPIAQPTQPTTVSPAPAQPQQQPPATTTPQPTEQQNQGPTNQQQ